MLPQYAAPMLLPPPPLLYKIGVLVHMHNSSPPFLVASSCLGQVTRPCLERVTRSCLGQVTNSCLGQ